MTKSELLEIINTQVPEDANIRVEGIIESGRGVVGDSNCLIEIEEDEDTKEYVLRVVGDEGCSTGFYE